MRITDAMEIVLRALYSETGVFGSDDDPTFVKAFLFDPSAADTDLFFRVGGITLKRFYLGLSLDKPSLNASLRTRLEDRGLPGYPGLPGAVPKSSTVLQLTNHVDGFGDRKERELATREEGFRTLLARHVAEHGNFGADEGDGADEGQEGGEQ